MNLWESITVALEGLAANKVRAMLTMLGVIIGVGAVITMLALAQGMREQTMGRIQQMGTNVLMIMAGQSRSGAVRGGFGSSQTLTLDDADAIAARCPSVLAVAPEVRQNSQVKFGNQNTNTSIMGVTQEYPAVRNYRVQEGRFISAGDVKALKKVAAIGTTTATNLFGTASPLGKTIRIKGIAFEIVGIMAPKGAEMFGDADDQIFIPITTAMRRVVGTQYVRQITVQARAMEVMDQATTEIEAVLRKTHRLAEGADSDFVIRNQADIMATMESINQSFKMLLAGISLVSLIVGGIGIMNIMLVSVTERTREIGIRMSLGAKRRDIMRQFLIESLVLSLCGGVVGILFGALGSWVLATATGWTLSISLISIALSFSFAAAVGIFFGLYPARQASRLDPIEALRYE